MPLPWSDVCHAIPADHAACRQLIRTGSRTFHAASLLLPGRVRDPALSLYAFCRLADDAVDEADDASGAIAQLRERLDRIYAGRPAPIAADRALADVVSHFAIPRMLPEALLEGFAWDAQGRRYETVLDLAAYAVRVAGTVGAMMALLMGVRSPEAAARAVDLATAMQFTNIARDVGEDARQGRLYLPLAWMREAGLEPESWIRHPVPSPALAQVVRALLAGAEALYRRSMGGIAQLPADCRPAIMAAALLYAEIGREVERRGFDPVSARAVVPSRRKLLLLSRAVADAARVRQGAPEPPLPAAGFLVEAVRAAPSPPRMGAGPGLSGRAIWVLDLFTRLEHRAVVPD